MVAVPKRGFLLFCLSGLISLIIFPSSAYSLHIESLPVSNPTPVHAWTSNLTAFVQFETRQDRLLPNPVDFPELWSPLVQVMAGSDSGIAVLRQMREVAQLNGKRGKFNASLERFQAQATQQVEASIAQYLRSGLPKAADVNSLRERIQRLEALRQYIGSLRTSRLY
jgi:hypothetical protein